MLCAVGALRASVGALMGVGGRAAFQVTAGRLLRALVMLLLALMATSDSYPGNHAITV